jgi:CIC family chloride channel protein
MMRAQSDTLRLTVATLLAGVLIGVIGGLFSLTLGWIDGARLNVINLSRAHALPDWLAALGFSMTGTALAALAAWLAQRFSPDAPQVPSAGADAGPPTSGSDLGALSVNFAGGSFAVGAGLALGPERPAIQMGGAIGRTVSRLLRLNRQDAGLLLASTGGAGVATMFNSPLGCAAYVVETVVKRVDLRLSLTALGAGALAVGVSRLMTGRSVNFSVDALPVYHFRQLVLYLLLGVLVGLLAYAQSRTIAAVVALVQRPRLPAVVRAGLIGAAAGLLAWQAPGVVGTGEAMVQSVLDGELLLSMLALVLLIRFLLGPLSLAATTPGGYFTPALLLGALSGALFGEIAGMLLPAGAVPPTAALALVGMAVALAAIAHAPFTGILLTLETTGAFIMALPMIVAVFGAIAVIRLLKSPMLSHGLENMDQGGRGGQQA